MQILPQPLMILLATMALVSCNTTTSEIKVDPLDFYDITFTVYEDGEIGTNVSADTSSNNPYETYIGQMSNHLDYWLMNYSQYFYHSYEIDTTYLPDTNRVKLEYQKLLKEDTLLYKLVSNSFERRDYGTVTLEELSHILSRFNYLHKPHYVNKPIVHKCISINEVKELPQRAVSPYLNAFCWDIFKNNKDAIWKEINDEFIFRELPHDASESVIDSARESNYSMTANNIFVIDLILKSYQEKKGILNFKIIE